MTNRKRNGNKANNGGKWIRPKKRRAIYERDDFRCVYCNRGIEDEIELTLDHRIPTELGGSNEATNLLTCCKQCNCSKRDKSMRAFMACLEKKGIDTARIKNRITRNIRRKLSGTRCRVKENEKWI